MNEILTKVNSVSVTAICCRMAPRGSGNCTNWKTQSLNGQTTKLARMTASTATVSRLRSSSRCSRSVMMPPSCSSGWVGSVSAWSASAIQSALVVGHGSGRALSHVRS